MFFLSSAVFLKITFFQKLFQEYHQRLSNSLDPDQARRSLGPDLVPNCLQKLSTEDTCRQRAKCLTGFPVLVSIPLGAMGRSVVFDCCISWSYP